MANNIFYGRKITNEGEAIVIYPKTPLKFKEELKQYRLLKKQIKQSKMTQEESNNV